MTDSRSERVSAPSKENADEVNSMSFGVRSPGVRSVVELSADGSVAFTASQRRFMPSVNQPDPPEPSVDGSNASTSDRSSGSPPQASSR